MLRLNTRARQTCGCWELGSKRLWGKQEGFHPSNPVGRAAAPRGDHSPTVCLAPDSPAPVLCVEGQRWAKVKVKLSFRHLSRSLQLLPPCRAPCS